MHYNNYRAHDHMQSFIFTQTYIVCSVNIQVYLGLDSFVRGAVFWEGEHVRLVLTPDDSKRLTKKLVSQVSASLRKIGCRCVLDDVKSGVIVKSRPIECFNRYEPLTQLDYSNETVSSSLNSDVQNDRVNVDVDLVGRKAKAMVRNKRERKLRLATWNFSGCGVIVNRRKLENC